MEKKITIRDIAKEAGVCIATVSNVLNKREIVDKKTIEKVEKVISKYNYRINTSASSLRGKLSKMIGVIIPDSSNLVFSYVTKEIEKLARDEDYSLVICNSDYNLKNEIEYINTLKSRDVDGIISIPSEENMCIFNNLNRSKIPVVLINREIKDSNIDFVMADCYNAIISVIDYLYKLGHKKIAYIDREINLTHSQKRLKGYKKGLLKNNLKFQKSFYLKGNGFSIQDGYSDMVKFLDMNEKPTAIIAFNDMLAIGAMRAILDRDYRVPDDFSVIGFDNSYIDEYLEPSLTSVTFERRQIAAESFKLLLNRMRGDKSAAKNVIIPLSLVIRKSTGKIKNLKNKTE